MPADMPGWLGWLRAEVESWWLQPGLVLSTVAIVTRPGTSISYAGEMRLREALLLRHMEVAWHDRLLARVDEG